MSPQYSGPTGRLDGGNRNRSYRPRGRTMNAMLQTRTNPAVRTARSSAATHRTRYEVRTDETSGAVTVRGARTAPVATLQDAG